MTIENDNVSLLSMMIKIFYILNVFLMFSGFLVFFQKSPDCRFTLTLLRSILFFPLLSAQYVYFFFNSNDETLSLILFSEAIFMLLWFCMGHRLHIASSSSYFKPYRLAIFEMTINVLLLISLGFSLVNSTPFLGFESSSLLFSFGNSIVLFTVFQLLVMLNMILRLEEFWKPLPLVRRWSFKYIVLGCSMVSFTYCIIGASRFLSLQFMPDYLLLTGVILLFAFASMLYAYIRHDLSDLEMIVSQLDRPAMSLSVSTVGLALLGFTSLGMNLTGLSVLPVLSCVSVLAGFAVVICVTLSQNMNRAVKVYLSTHFSVKKYEYREAWLDFCNHLQGQLSKDGVAKALASILSRTLYTNNILVWTGNESKGFMPTFFGSISPEKVSCFSGDDRVLGYLRNNNFFYIRDNLDDDEWRIISEEKKTFLRQHNLVLLFPLIISDNFVGLIGVGPEFHSGNYGRDDFDLLAALGTQASSALLTVDMAEELASVRERKVWDKFSSFVLHDLKNAANILSLVQENARVHINNPEFQDDMLECIDDALKRMAKVQDRLNLLKGQIVPKLQLMDVGNFLETVVCKRFERSLSGLLLKTKLPDDVIEINTDPEMLFPVMENVILNALEAGGDNTSVILEVARDDEWVRIFIKDSGPGIAENMLPDKLFDPFKTSKNKGSGIGLWQAKQMVTFLEGEIKAKNNSDKGACFEVRLPLG